MLRVGKETGRLGAAIRGGGKRLAVGLLAGSLLVAGLGTTGTAAVSPDADPGVIRDWNATMVATIVVDAGKANAEAFMWFGFVQAAVYNAVVGITRDYELYQWDKRGPQSASPEAAAAAGCARCAAALLPRIADTARWPARHFVGGGHRRVRGTAGREVRTSRGGAPHPAAVERWPERADHVRSGAGRWRVAAVAERRSSTRGSVRSSR